MAMLDGEYVDCKSCGEENIHRDWIDWCEECGAYYCEKCYEKQFVKYGYEDEDESYLAKCDECVLQEKVEYWSKNPIEFSEEFLGIELETWQKETVKALWKFEDAKAAIWRMMKREN